MKKLLPLLILMSACSTIPNSAYRKSAADENVKSDDDYNWINQLNFDKKTETKYLPENDRFKFIPDENKHALAKESLANLPPVRLEETLGKEDDVLVKINVRCYQNKFDEGMKIADEVYEQYKGNTSYWNQLGTCYYLKNDYANAILFYNKSRDLDAKYAPPINNLGVVYGRQGKYQKGLSAFKKAMEVNPFGTTPVYNLASLYLKFGIVDKALVIFQNLQKKSPQDIEVTSAIASAYLLKGEYDLALSIYQKMDKEILMKPDVGLNYAVSLKLANRTQEAQVAFDNVARSANIEINEYSQKVEKFIRK